MPLDRLTHPPLTRVLILDNRTAGLKVYEITIVEWSPSGLVVRIRFRDQGNREEWTNDLRDGARLEILP